MFIDDVFLFNKSWILDSFYKNLSFNFYYSRMEENVSAKDFFSRKTRNYLIIFQNKHVENTAYTWYFIYRVKYIM